MKDLYNINSNKFEYVSYRSQDIFFNEEDKCQLFKDSAGRLKINETKSNKLRCHTNTGISFDKEVISDKISKENRINGFCSQVQKSYLYNYNRVMTESILKLGGKKLSLVNGYQDYINPFYYKEKELKKEWGDYWKIKKDELSIAIDNRNLCLDSGKVIKVQLSLKHLKKDLDENLIGIYDVLSNSDKRIYQIPEITEDYSILYTLCLLQKLTEADYNNRKELTKAESYIPLNSVWTTYKLPENCQLNDFIKIIEKVKNNNNQILIQEKYPEERFVDVIAWNFIKKLNYNKKDEVFLTYLKNFNNLKNNTWAVLDKNYALKNNIVFIMALDKESCQEVINLFQLPNLALYDSIKKQFLIPIRFSEKVYDNVIEYIQNIITAKEINALCSELYSDTTVANFNNSELKLIDTKIWKKINEKKEIILTTRNNPVINHIANPFKYTKPEVLKGIRLELNIKSQIKINPYKLGWKKSKIITKNNGDVIYQENDNPKKLVGIEFLSYIENSYIGKKINKFNDIFEKINQRLKKNGKPQISNNVSRNLLHLIFSNFMKAGIDLVTYNRNTISTDSKISRRNQTYYMSADVRAGLIKESIIQFASNSDLSSYKTQEEFEQAIKILTRYETALAIYKTINEDFFNLNKVKVKNDSYSAADISLSYEPDLDKMIKKISNISGIDIQPVILKKEDNDWAKDQIKNINKKELKELKINAGVDLYKNCFDVKKQKVILAIRCLFSLHFDFIIKLFDRIRYKLNRSTLLNQILHTDLKLPYYLKSEIWT